MSKVVDFTIPEDKLEKWGFHGSATTLLVSSKLAKELDKTEICGHRQALFTMLLNLNYFIYKSRVLVVNNNIQY